MVSAEYCSENNHQEPTKSQQELDQIICGNSTFVAANFSSEATSSG
jgi:hypothetical protein